MLPKAHRVPLQHMLGASHHGAPAIRMPLFIVRMRETERSMNRFGILVPKKFDKRSSRRNRVRRLIFHAIRANDLLAASDVASGRDVAIFISPEARGTDPERIAQEVGAALRNLLRADR